MLLGVGAAGRVLVMLWWRRRLFRRLSLPDSAGPARGGNRFRAYVPVFGAIGKQLTWNRGQMARWLDLAGRPHGWDLETVMTLRGLTLTGGLLLGTLVRFLGLGGPVTMLVLALAGYLAPDWWLWSAARRRQAQLAGAVPDVMDLIATCLEADAGLTIPQVLARAEAHLDGPIQEEIRYVNRQVEMGVPREQAYQTLIERNACEELAVLVEPLRRGGELGVPIAETVRVQAGVLRQIRRRRARWAGERADLAVSVITFALALPAALGFIFALIFLVLVTRPEALGLRLW